MSVQSIRQGEMSARTSDGGAYSARLAAFQEEYTRPQFTDTVKEFTDIINADQIKAEKFTESALGTKVVPSTTNMYESHFLLAKEKFDQLYSDETLDYFSKDEGGMQKWAGMVDKLNQEIKTYEQIYEDSWGTASANGEGFTWQDYQKRILRYGGDESQWFNGKGLKLLSTGRIKERMKMVDSRGHSNLTLDLESGTFNYDLAGDVDKNWLEPTDPNTAANLFSYEAEAGAFRTAIDYANQYKEMYKKFGKEGVDASLTNLFSSDTFNLDSNNFQIMNMGDDDKNKNNTPQQQRIINEEYGTQSTANELFKEDILGLLEKSKEEEEQDNNTNTTGGRTYASSIYLRGALSQTQVENFTTYPGDIPDDNPVDGNYSTISLKRDTLYINGRNVAQILWNGKKGDNARYYAVNHGTEPQDITSQMPTINNILKDENRDFNQRLGLDEFAEGSSGGSGDNLDPDVQ